jgi:hypothetical protein
VTSYLYRVLLTALPLISFFQFFQSTVVQTVFNASLHASETEFEFDEPFVKRSSAYVCANPIMRRGSTLTVTKLLSLCIDRCALCLPECISQIRNGFIGTVS